MDLPNRVRQGDLLESYAVHESEFPHLRNASVRDVYTSEQFAVVAGVSP